MRRAVLALFVLALVFVLVPAAGAISDKAPHAVSWEQTDIMAPWVMLDASSTCINDAWIQSHISFFRGGTGSVMPADPFDNAGRFEATENGTIKHSGMIWWIASGRTKLISLNPTDPCDLSAEFPLQGEFRGRGMMRITASPTRLGVTCTLGFGSHLTGVPPSPAGPPVVTWTGNYVAHCDDGAKIHLEIVGPTDGPGLGVGGMEQLSSGIILDK